VIVEDYQEQEYEFWRRLDEESVSRSTFLRRGIAAGAGLTVLSLSDVALAARARALANPPLKGTPGGMKALIAAAKKEGKVNDIALPDDWANYGGMIAAFKKKYGIDFARDNPSGSSAAENQAIVSLKGDPRAPDCVDVGPSFAVQGAAAGLYARYFVTTYKTIPRSMKDTRGFWTGDYWGAVSIGWNGNLVQNAPRTFADLAKSEYKGKVAINGSPLTSNSAVAVVLAASLANGGSLNNVGPGIDYFAKLKKSGNYIVAQTTPQTVASGVTPISLDWDYNNLAYVSEFPAAKWKVTVPSDGVYGGYYCQAVNATAPHPYAARLWQEFLFSDQGQILYLKGFAHPARFTDMVGRKVIPKALLAALPSAAIYNKVKFASLGQISKAAAQIKAEWPSKVGG
jgi:putative spermidine/putrescine transport system substrate-binding protein